MCTSLLLLMLKLERCMHRCKARSKGRIEWVDTILVMKFSSLVHECAFAKLESRLYHTQTFKSGILKWCCPTIHRTMGQYSLTTLDIIVGNLFNSVSMKCTRPILQSAWQNCSLQFVHWMKQFWMLMKVDIQGRGEESMWHRTTRK